MFWLSFFFFNKRNNSIFNQKKTGQLVWWVRFTLVHQFFPILTSSWSVLTTSDFMVKTEPAWGLVPGWIGLTGRSSLVLLTMLIWSRLIHPFSPPRALLWDIFRPYLEDGILEEKGKAYEGFGLILKFYSYFFFLEMEK